MFRNTEDLEIKMIKRKFTLKKINFLLFYFVKLVYNRLSLNDDTKHYSHCKMKCPLCGSMRVVSTNEEDTF